MNDTGSPARRSPPKARTRIEGWSAATNVAGIVASTKNGSPTGSSSSPEPGAERPVDALGADVPRREVVGQRDLDRRRPAGVGADEPPDQPVAEVAAGAVVAATARRVPALAVGVIARGLVRPDRGDDAAADARVERVDGVDHRGVAGREQLLVDRLHEDARGHRPPRRIERADRHGWPCRRARSASDPR